MLDSLPLSLFAIAVGCGVGQAMLCGWLIARAARVDGSAQSVWRDALLVLAPLLTYIAVARFGYGFVFTRNGPPPRTLLLAPYVSALLLGFAGIWLWAKRR
jgi:hypothetical protein